ncbi:hypothetical protein C2G38_2161609 [Gigaspora rosea]|uniref:Uncharacterized protein n=1 Tax=Gigaspora rosea TaxID=44941 RepID=A0A397VYM0_9GLOM|nr:hypothetical protein C2G38_2161609 [Gigaspora rosea]
MVNERTILSVGRTGKDCSTLANVISSTINFKESEHGIMVAKEAYNLLRTVLFAEDIGKYTTIVQTHFPSFHDSEQRQKNKEVMMSQNEDVATILHFCQ